MKSDGTMSVTYEYDAWGNIVSTSRNGSDAYGLYTLNVYTYRGYIYDIDTGFYYLQSRYYDPEVGRFLNVDDINYLGATGTTLGYNLYNSCENNSIWFQDPCGHKPGRLFTRVTEAVMDFADIYNKISIKKNWEYATFIYRISVLIYVSATRWYWAPRYSFYEPWTDKSDIGVRVPKAKNTKNYEIVAIVHTHGKYRNFVYDSENFSSGDINVSKSYQADMYLVTPGGKIKKYEYATKTQSTFSYRTYHDYKSMFNLPWKRHFCYKCAN